MLAPRSWTILEDTYSEVPFNEWTTNQIKMHDANGIMSSIDGGVVGRARGEIGRECSKGWGVGEGGYMLFSLGSHTPSCQQLPDETSVTLRHSSQTLCT